MKNSHALLIVVGTALVGLMVGSLVSRRPSTPESPPPPEPRQEPRRSRPAVAEAPAAQAAPPRAEQDTGSAPAPARPAKPAKAAKGASDERKNVALHPEDPTVGPANAKVTIVEFSDFQCPFCSKASVTVQKIRELYGDKTRLVFKHHPLPFHKDAALAHQAAAEANAQGRFWEFHDRLFGNQKALGRTDLEATAQSLGLDMARFRTALDSGVHKAHIEKDTAQSAELGSTGTPAFFINGRLLSGAQPLESFKAVIDEELGR